MKVMKVGVIALILLLAGLVLAFEFFAGSNWRFIASKSFLLYEHVDAPLDTLPVIAEVNSGEEIGVEQCFFDKSDAYLLVKMQDGRVGYTFDILQPYKRSWHFVFLNFNDGSLARGLTCWRLASQFGNRTSKEMQRHDTN